MDNDSLRNIGTSLNNVAGAIAERLRHDGSASTSFNFEEAVAMEALRLRGEGQEQLADALAALGKDSGQ